MQSQRGFSPNKDKMRASLGATDESQNAQITRWNAYTRQSHSFNQYRHATGSSMYIIASSFTLVKVYVLGNVRAQFQIDVTIWHSEPQTRTRLDKRDPTPSSEYMRGSSLGSAVRTSVDPHRNNSNNTSELSKTKNQHFLHPTSNSVA